MTKWPLPSHGFSLMAQSVIYAEHACVCKNVQMCSARTLECHKGLKVSFLLLQDN